MADDLITTTEAGDILGCDPSTIRHRILAGKLHSVKRGRDLYVSRKTIQAEADSKARTNGNKPKGK
jgi:hypothetical protein